MRSTEYIARKQVSNIYLYAMIIDVAHIMQITHLRNIRTKIFAIKWHQITKRFISLAWWLFKRKEFIASEIGATL